MNDLAQPLLDRRRALELRAWVALVDRATTSELACARLLQDMYETGVAYQRTSGGVQRLRIAGVSSDPVALRVPASDILRNWLARAMDRLAAGVAQ